MTALSDRLADAKGNDSIDAIAERAAAAGHKIDRATVWRYIAGTHAKNPPDSVLRALAAGFGLDVRELRTLAGKPAGELGKWTPPDEAARLSQDQRRALDQLIKSIVREEVGNDERSAPTKKELERAESAGREDLLDAILQAAIGAEPSPPTYYAHPQLHAAYARGWQTLKGDDVRDRVDAGAAATDAGGRERNAREAADDLARLRALQESADGESVAHITQQAADKDEGE